MQQPPADLSLFFAAQFSQLLVFNSLCRSESNMTWFLITVLRNYNTVTWRSLNKWWNFEDKCMMDLGINWSGKVSSLCQLNWMRTFWPNSQFLSAMPKSRLNHGITVFQIYYWGLLQISQDISWTFGWIFLFFCITKDSWFLHKSYLSAAKIDSSDDIFLYIGVLAFQTILFCSRTDFLKKKASYLLKLLLVL